jgi:hypothetical protein
VAVDGAASAPASSHSPPSPNLDQSVVGHLGPRLWNYSFSSSRAWSRRMFLQLHHQQGKFRTLASTDLLQLLMFFNVVVDPPHLSPEGTSSWWDRTDISSATECRTSSLITVSTRSRRSSALVVILICCSKSKISWCSVVNISTTFDQQAGRSCAL